MSDDKQAEQDFEAAQPAPQIDASDVNSAAELLAQTTAAVPSADKSEEVSEPAEQAEPAEPAEQAEQGEDASAADAAPVAATPLERKRNAYIAELEELDERDEEVPRDTLSVGLSQEVQDHLDALSSVVLDSADVAARSANVATGLASEMRNATKVVDSALVKATLHSKIVLGVTAGLLLIAMGVFFAMAASLQSRIGQADDMLLAVGKRVVELNAGIEGINAMNRTLATFGDSTSALIEAQAKLEERVKTALGESNALVSSLPKEAAKSIEAGSQALVKQVGALDGQLKKQAGAISALSGQMKALKSAVGEVDPLKRDVQALITLQKQRYLEALQQQNSSSQRDQAVTYPRPAPPKGDAPSAPAAQ